MMSHSVWIHSLPSDAFMVRDVLGSLVAVPAFAAVFFAPGYVAAHVVNPFAFRERPFAQRSLWALACSFCVTPALAYLAGKVGGLRLICGLLMAAAAVTAVLLLRARSRAAWSRRQRTMTALLGGACVLGTMVLLVDVQAGHKLFFSVVMADQSYRIAFTDAVARTGVPPANPLYFAGRAAPMRYYYFWYVLCAAVMKLAHVSARQAFVASSAWAGFGLMVTVWLYSSHFFRWEPRRRWIALGLLLVSGADLIPALGQAFLQASLNGDTEWWSVDPLDSWPDSLLWVPHHVAGVLCCLLGFLLLWHAVQPGPVRDRRWATALAGVAFASAFGLSVYVAVGFAVLIGAWLLRLVLRGAPECSAWLRSTAAAGGLSLLLLAPFLRELALGLRANVSKGSAETANATTHLFSLSVRRMIDSGMLTGLPVFAHWDQAHPVLLDQALRIVLLAPGLTMELGVYGVVLMWLLQERSRSHRPAGPALDAALFFSVAGLVMTMFLSSSVITNNDFGFRAVMLPQFFLLLLTAEVLGGGKAAAAVAPVPLGPGRRRMLSALVVLGVAGLGYWAVLLRAWLPIEVTHPENGFSDLPGDGFQIREAFAVLDRVASPAAVVAFRPIDPTPDRKDAVMVPNEFYQRMLVMNIGRQMLNAEGKCAVHFGGDPAPCLAIQQNTAALYALPAPGAPAALEFCHRFGVSYLVLSAWDPDWHAGGGWPTALPQVVQEPRLRILRCD